MALSYSVCWLTVFRTTFRCVTQHLFRVSRPHPHHQPKTTTASHDAANQTDSSPYEPLPSHDGHDHEPHPKPLPATTPPQTKPPVDDPGPPPAGCGTITKDAAGFFTRTSAKSPYVGFVPKGYSGQPTTLVVGLHGCGDTAMNFATTGASAGACSEVVRRNDVA